MTLKLRPHVAITYLAITGAVSMLLWTHCGSMTGMPNDRPLEDYLAETQTKFKAGLDEGDWLRVVSVQTTLGERILKLEREKVEGDRWTEIPSLDAYVTKGQYADLEKIFLAEGLIIDEARLLPINGVDGNQLMDERMGEACYALEPVKQRFEEANQAYHKRTGRELTVNACWRGRNRQISNKAIAVYGCLVRKIGKKKSFERTLAGIESATDSQVSACMRSTASTERTPFLDSGKPGPVGGILTSLHSVGDGLDIASWSSAEKELKASGFNCGLKAGWGRKIDKNHCSLRI